MNNSVSEKTIENVREHKNIMLTLINKRRIKNSLHDTTKSFSENLLAVEMKQTKVKRYEPVILGLSILKIRNNFNV